MEDAFVAADFVMHHQHLEHDHPRPPVGVARTKKAALILAVQRPLYPGLDLVQQALVIEQMCKGQQAVEVVGTALPDSPSPPASRCRRRRWARIRRGGPSAHSLARAADSAANHAVDSAQRQRLKRGGNRGSRFAGSLSIAGLGDNRVLVLDRAAHQPVHIITLERQKNHQAGDD